jgi:subtilisin family serine protease
MATPHFAGVLALMWAQFPSESYQSLTNRLLDSADSPIAAVTVISGGVNLLELLKRFNNMDVL